MLPDLHRLQNARSRGVRSERDAVPQPGCAEGHDRKQGDEQYLEAGDHHAPPDIDDLLSYWPIPAARLIDIAGSVISPMTENPTLLLS
jgi:hypothetical protein